MIHRVKGNGYDYLLFGDLGECDKVVIIVENRGEYTKDSISIFYMYLGGTTIGSHMHSLQPPDYA